MSSLFNRRRERAQLARWFSQGGPREARPEVPLVFIPSMFGVRLVDAHGACLWGDIPRVFRGPPLSSVERARPDGIIEGFAGFDLYGGLLRFLRDAGGYELGRSLFVLNHDWRRGVIEGGHALSLLLQKLRARGVERFDVAAFSSGGLMARYGLAYGHEDVRAHPDWPARGAPRGLRRLVYIGAPHRGGLSAIYLLWYGHRLVPHTRLFPPSDVAHMQIFFDLLPPPDEPICCDPDGRDLDLSLDTLDFWRRFGIRAHRQPGFLGRLEDAAHMHRALHRTPPHPETWVIGCRERHTARRLIVRDGRLTYPEPWDPSCAFARSPGDGALLATSLTAVPGLPPERVIDVAAPGHIELITQHDTHRALLRTLQGHP